LRVTWFNQPWIGKRLRNGMQVVLSGKVEQYLGRLVMNNPEVEQLEQQNLHTNRIVPIYSLTARITQRWLRRLMYQVVIYWSPRIQDPLPRATRRAAEVIDLPIALQEIHFPNSWEALKAARNRLAFDELFLLQLGLLGQKRSWQERSARVFATPDEWLEEQLSRLPYTLTAAQQRAVERIREDLAEGHPMNRLLQGDVGSGKTVVAALAIAMVVRHGVQAALMAPTSILAEQHYQSLRDILAGEGGLLSEDQIRLLIGATPETEKQAIREGLASGEIKVVIGTHALIEDRRFADLGAIIDEQHRFGVEQRAALRQKGRDPHLVVMSATPIPRSLALTVYGDLDLLVLDEMPPGRQPVDTHVLLPRERERSYALIRSQVERGRQAFIIYPLIEQGEEADSNGQANENKAAVEEHTRLQSEVFPDLSLGLLHGRLRRTKRRGHGSGMANTSWYDRWLRSGECPTTVMLVEGAEHFGLAQYQFRGRVGCGQDQAYLLVRPGDCRE
jgi:ATP-dependent DNA helicase RecG